MADITTQFPIPSEANLSPSSTSRTKAVGYDVPNLKNILFLQHASVFENYGGVEYYLVEQEGSRYPELETAQRCLQAFRQTHPA